LFLAYVHYSAHCARNALQGTQMANRYSQIRVKMS